MTTLYLEETPGTDCYSGYGIFIQKDKNHNDYYVHTGRIGGYHSYISYIPALEICIGFF